MAEPETFTVELNGFSSRIWKAGNGPKLGFIAGFGGLPRWVPFLDALAKERTIIVPSLPGFPGGELPKFKAAKGAAPAFIGAALTLKDQEGRLDVFIPGATLQGVKKALSSGDGN